MAIPLNDNTKIEAPKPSEERYLKPDGTRYVDAQDVINTIPFSRRYIDMVVSTEQGFMIFDGGRQDSDLKPYIVGSNLEIDDTIAALDKLWSSQKIQDDLDLKANDNEISIVGKSNNYNDLDNKPDLSAFDNIEEYPTFNDFPVTGESNKYYLNLATGILHRWNGTAYVIISGQLALGITSDTAYRGDRGKTAYVHSQVIVGNPHNVTKSDVGLSNVDNVKQYPNTNPLGFITGVSNITDIPNRNYNDLQNLPLDTNVYQVIDSGGNYNNFEVTGDIIVFSSTLQAQAIITGFDNSVYKRLSLINNSNFELRLNAEDANSVASNQIKLPTGLASIGIQGTCELVYVDDIQRWQIVDAFASKYRPEHRGLTEARVEVVLPNAVSETREIIELIVFRDAQSSTMSKADLNAAYPDRPRGFQVVCKQIDTIYIKVDNNTNDWQPITTGGNVL